MIVLPVAGGWSPWGSWGTCSSSCTSTRSRGCRHVSFVGSHCLGLKCTLENLTYKLYVLLTSRCPAGEGCPVREMIQTWSCALMVIVFVFVFVFLCLCFLSLFSLKVRGCVWVQQQKQQQQDLPVEAAVWLSISVISKDRLFTADHFSKLLWDVNFCQDV